MKQGVNPKQYTERAAAVGFTLVEMLIAVVVIAVVGIAVSSAIGSVANQTYSLERKTLAHWVGQNQANRIRIEQRRASKVVPEGKDTTRVLMGHRDWEVVTQVKATDSPLIRRIEIDVYELLDGKRSGPYDHLVTFLGRN